MAQLVRILIADDQPHYCHLVSKVLRAEGYQTEIVDNVNSVWKHLNVFQPDMVLLHALSEGFDSYSLLMDIKQLEPKFPALVYVIQSRDAIDRLKESITSVLEENRTVELCIKSNIVRSGRFRIHTTTQSKVSLLEN